MLEFDNETHLGRVNGVVYPSVTQLIQEFKFVDYSMVDEETLEYKRVLGTAVDYACDLWEQNNLDIDSLHPDIFPYFEAYRKWREICGIEPDMEKSLNRVLSKKYRFHGSPDIVYHIDGNKYGLIDRKCTWVLYKSGHLQCQLYKMLLEEVHGIKIIKKELLQLKKNGTYKLESPKDKVIVQDAQALIFMHWRKREAYNIKENLYFPNKRKG